MSHNRREFLASAAALVVLGTVAKEKTLDTVMLPQTNIEPISEFPYEQFVTVEFNDNPEGNFKSPAVNFSNLQMEDLSLSYTVRYRHFSQIPVIVLNTHPDAVRIKVDSPSFRCLWYKKHNENRWMVFEEMYMDKYAHDAMGLAISLTDPWMGRFGHANFTIEGEGSCRVAVSSYKPLELPSLERLS